MALDVYFRSDIENGIRAAMVMAVHTHLAGGACNVEHISGIMALAHSQATLYGLSWSAIVASCQHELGADVGGLLSVAPMAIES